VNAQRIAIILLTVSMATVAYGRELAPLAGGGAPPCSRRNGIREFHSAVVQNRDTSAFILGIARRDASGCHKRAEIRIESAGATKSFPLPSDAEDFEIVDFSPDGSKLFLADEKSDVVQIAAMPIASGELRWHDISDLLDWKDCEATVEPLGYAIDGKLAVRARRSVMSSPKRPNCVSLEHVYAFDAHWKTTDLRADVGSIKRNGKKVHPPSQACQSDPDLIGECFTVRGRLSAWNGNPTFRIWRIGTKRIMGLAESMFPSDQVVLPGSLDGRMAFGVEAYGDFLVCPITIDTPDRMQMVCIESANHLVLKDR